MPRSSDGGKYSQVIKKYKRIKKDNPRTEILIWIDYDIYERNDNKNGDHYRSKPRGIPDFHFSYFNFEDFLTLHMEENFLETWQRICTSNNHFLSPMHAIIYEPLFKENIIIGYEKGTMPFQITEEHLNRLWKNQDDSSILFHCDFAIFLKNLVNETQS